jgi:hypothetical protein
MSRGFVALAIAVTLCAMPSCGGGKKKNTPANHTAHINLKRMIDGARAYYDSEHVAPGEMSVYTMYLPDSNAGPTPPYGTCCADGGKCNVYPDEWEAPEWRALKFSIDAPDYFSYGYHRSGTPGSPDYGFTALAWGDLDCDDQRSTFMIEVTIDPTVGLVPGPFGQFDPVE